MLGDLEEAIDGAYNLQYDYGKIEIVGSLSKEDSEEELSIHQQKEEGTKKTPENKACDALIKSVLIGNSTYPKKFLETDLFQKLTLK
jgi:hypothetical protein